MNTGFLDPAVATVPTACGIETEIILTLYLRILHVATVPTACGIETGVDILDPGSAVQVSCNSTYRLRY